jgi:hypothetical protein
MRYLRFVVAAMGFLGVAAGSVDALAMYQPAVGRWMQRDPAGYPDGANSYQDVRSNPAAGTDPQGLWGADDHRTLTRTSLNAAFPQRLNLRGDVVGEPLGSTACRAWILANLIEGNRSQDDETANFNDLRRHYNRHIPEGVAAANAAFTAYIKEELDGFANLMEWVKPEYRPSKGHACRQALLTLGRLTHTWQDYYAHAVLLNGNPSPAWSANPPITGSPDNLNPQLKASSWESLANRGEHGPALWDLGRPEPADRDTAGGRNGRLGRFNDAQQFVTLKLQQYLPLWLQRCHCWCPPSP